MRGGREHYGRTPVWHLLADVYDALNINTLATGNWRKGKEPKFEPYPRPDRAPEKPSDSKKPGARARALHAMFNAAQQ